MSLDPLGVKTVWNFLVCWRQLNPSRVVRHTTLLATQIISRYLVWRLARYSQQYPFQGNRTRPGLHLLLFYDLLYPFKCLSDGHINWLIFLCRRFHGSVSQSQSIIGLGRIIVLDQSFSMTPNLMTCAYTNQFCLDPLLSDDLEKEREQSGPN